MKIIVSLVTKRPESPKIFSRIRIQRVDQIRDDTMFSRQVEAAESETFLSKLAILKVHAVVDATDSGTVPLLASMGFER